jgi:peptide-methionine (S)-S-oxide reductase
MNTETITLGAGCFWCIENIFSRVKGVVSAVSGYANGDIENPSYEQVVTGNTNHAEVIQLTFDREKLSIEQILMVFFAIHDPTTINRQGHDVGSQYRSTILFQNSKQELAAMEKIATLTSQQTFEQEIVTDVKELDNFYSAESYHRDYFTNNPENRYCQLVVAKKIQKFLRDFSHLLKDE